MTTKKSSGRELQELNEWIAVNVFNCKKHSEGWEPGDTWEGELDCLVSEFTPTTDPAAAFEVLKKCLETREMPNFYKLLSDETYSIRVVADGCCSLEQGKKIQVIAETLELAICLFAKHLFSK